ncbi:MAG TPA: CvpA family protein [Puia sp.]|nr:CvpA family protein [Puia sp.]
MQGVDLLFLVVIILSAWSGWRSGFIYAAIGLILWVGSLAAAFCLYPYAVRPLARLAPGLGVWTLPVAFLAVLLAARLLLWLFFSRLLAMLPPEAHTNPVNKLLGILPGLINGVVAAAVIALLFMALPLSARLTEQLRRSRLADDLTWPAEWVEERLSPVFEQPVERTIARMSIEPHSEESVKLPYTTRRLEERPDLEREMLQLVNRERARRGIGPLVSDTALRAVARAHCIDMFERGYFSHYTPEGKDPFDRMRAAHIGFLSAGENLALAQTLSIAHTGLMHSPGHRANILNPAFHRVGIGIIEGGVHGLMISQEFRN